MYFIKVYAIYKDPVSDPQEETVEKAVRHMGYETIEDIRVGEYFEIRPANAEEPIDIAIEMVCNKLFTSVNMEIYRYEIKKMGEI